MKPYIFNGEVFNDLDTLAHSYIENFDLGIEDIYANSKKLVKFVKSVSKDKELVSEVVSILAYSKYKNNALTFIIYTFLNDKKVIINGKEFTMESFINELKAYPDITSNNILYAFMEDYGISKTFAKEDENSKFAVDSFFIEKNYKDKFTYKYLTTFYNYQVNEAPYAQLSTIAINGEECFRRATKVAHDEDFQLGLAHKLGFKAAIDMHNDPNPLFKAIKLLKEKKEVADDELKKLITDTFYWWLLDNLDKYQALKNEAKETFTRLYELKKEYDGYQEKIQRREITDISLDLLADLSRGIYLNYINFVTLFRDGKIMVKQKFSEASYSFDKPYCRTYITADFMKDHIVKLYNPNKDEKKVITINPLTGAEIELDEDTRKEIDVDDISDDRPVLIKIDDENIINEIEFSKKVLRKNSRLAAFAITMTLFFGIIAIAASVLSIIFKNQDLGKFSDAIKNVNNVAIMIIALASVSLIVVLACGITLNVLSQKTLKDVNTLLFITNAKTKEKVSPKQESKLITLLTNEEKYKKSVKKRYKFIRLSTAVFHALSFALIIVLLVIIGQLFINVFKFKSTIISVLLASIIGPALGSLIILFKKKNGILSLLLIDLITLIAVLVFAILGV